MRVCKWIAVLLPLFGAQAFAQDAGATIAVRIHVTDTLHQPVRDAEATLSHGDSVLTRRRTDSTGIAVLRVQAGVGYGLDVRKVGFDEDRQSLLLQATNAIPTIDVILSPLAVRLGPVVVTDMRLPLDRQPYIGAAEIAASSRSILSLDDVIGKLRPFINYRASRCLPLPRSGPVSEGLIPRARQVHPPAVVVYVDGRRIPPEWNPWDMIHSEHIQEIQYVNCLDGSVAGLPKLSWPAIYVVLKPGIEWDPRHGSFAVDSVPPD